MIVLEEVYDGKKYLGKIVIFKEHITEAFLRALDDDVDDVQGWKKYSARMKEYVNDIERRHPV